MWTILGTFANPVLLGRLWWVTIVTIFELHSQANAAPTYDNTAQICEKAAVYAAQETGVPLSVLLAISLTETGRTKKSGFRPWPWTVNMEGKGVWFESQLDALAYVERHFKAGARSFDVGCFQINYKWHGKAFTSVDQMFDPSLNAVYAAKYLTALFNEKGSWEEAAGAYHSRTKKYADKYKLRFKRIRSDILASNSDKIDAKRPHFKLPKSAKPNRFPLLVQRPEGSAGAGSLVRLSDTAPAKTMLLSSAQRLF